MFFKALGFDSSKTRIHRLHVSRIATTENRKKVDCPGDFIPEVRLVWTTGVLGVKVSSYCIGKTSSGLE